MRFVDAEHLQAYAPHPAHQVVSKELQDMGSRTGLVEAACDVVK